MSVTLTAYDVWPLVRKLAPEERARLVAMTTALNLSDAGQDASDAEKYVATPVRPGEFSAENDGLAWDAEGWDEFDPAR